MQELLRSIDSALQSCVITSTQAFELRKVLAVKLDPTPPQPAVKKPSVRRLPDSVNLPTSFLLRAGVKPSTKHVCFKDALRDKAGNLPPFQKLLKLGLKVDELYHLGFTVEELEPIDLKTLQSRDSECVAGDLGHYFGISADRLYEIAESDLSKFVNISSSAEGLRKCGVTIAWLIQRGLTADLLTALPCGVRDAVTYLNLTKAHLFDLGLRGVHTRASGWSYTEIRQALSLTNDEMTQLGLDIGTLLTGQALQVRRR